MPFPLVSALSAPLIEGSGESDNLWGNGNVENYTYSPLTSTSVNVAGNDDDSPGEWPDRIHNISFVSSMFGVHYCTEWGPVNHVYFQLANTFFFLSYLAPNGMYGILYLRCTLLVGCAFFALWGWSVHCSFDAFLWNANFVGINFIHVCVLLYYLRPVKFSREVEEVSG